MNNTQGGVELKSRVMYSSLRCRKTDCLASVIFLYTAVLNQKRDPVEDAVHFMAT